MILKRNGKELAEFPDWVGYVFFTLLFMSMFMFFHQFDETREVCYNEKGVEINLSFCEQTEQYPFDLNISQTSKTYKYKMSSPDKKLSQTATTQNIILE